MNGEYRAQSGIIGSPAQNGIKGLRMQGFVHVFAKIVIKIQEGG